MHNLLNLNKDWIINNNIVINDYRHNIWLLENFLTEEMSNNLIAHIKSLSEKDWRKLYLHTIIRRYNQPWRENQGILETNEDIIHAIATRQIINLDEFFGDYQQDFDKSIEIKEYQDVELFWERWNNIFEVVNTEDKERFTVDKPNFVDRKYKGTSTREHQDGSPDGSLVYATILYINEDFKGGELYFPELDISIKPKKGSLCVFDASNNWFHGVKTITEGTRYSIPIFVWDSTKNERHREKIR
jgi:hypothetical protein